MKIFTWNICSDFEGAKGGNLLSIEGRESKILSEILKYEYDIIVLTEFGLAQYKYVDKNGKIKGGTINGTYIKNELERNGYDADFHNISGRAHCSVIVAVRTSKFNTVKIIENNPADFTNRWVEVTINDKESGDKIFNLLGVYIPIGDDFKNADKEEFWNNVIRFANSMKGENAIIIGDFNTYLAEDSEQNTPSPLSGKITELKTLNWVDSWRLKHEDDDEKYTWFSKIGNGFRLDYAFLSHSLAKRLITTKHLSKAKEEKRLSDHSALMVEINIK